MDTKKINKKPFDSMKNYFEGLNDDKKGQVAMVSLIGDMDENYNYSQIIGTPDNLIMTIAQEMVLNGDFKTVIKDAVKLVETYEKEELSKYENYINSKYVS